MRRLILTSAERREWRYADIDELRFIKYFVSNRETSVVGSYQEQQSPAGRFNEQSREARGIHKELQVCWTTAESTSTCSDVLFKEG